MHVDSWHRIFWQLDYHPHEVLALRLCVIYHEEATNNFWESPGYIPPSAAFPEPERLPGSVEGSWWEVNHEYESASLHPLIQNAVARICFFVCLSYHIITFLKFTLCHPFVNYIQIQAAAVFLQDLDKILFCLCICSLVLLFLLLWDLPEFQFSLFLLSFCSGLSSAPRVFLSICLMLLCTRGLGFGVFFLTEIWATCLIQILILLAYFWSDSC